MILTRRLFCAGLTAAIVPSLSRPVQADQPLTVTDMTGRKITLAAPPRRIILLEAHDLLTMSLLHPDPASLVVGWAAADRIDSEQMSKRLLNDHTVSVVGMQSPDTVLLEGLVALSPDLVVTTHFMTPGGAADPMVNQLAGFGVPVVFSDAASNRLDDDKQSDPVVELKTLMKMWGGLLNKAERANAFSTFFEQQIADVTARIAGEKPVTTYLELQSTPGDCCWAAGRKIWGKLLEMAGGQTLPGITAPWYQQISLEQLLATPHDVYIASGGGWAAAGRPAIGPGLDADKGRDGLQRVIEGRPAFDQLASVRNKRAHGIWTGLITNLPLNVVFVALVARWLHPERCADIDATAILDTINRDFAAFPIEGPLWVSL